MEPENIDCFSELPGLKWTYIVDIPGLDTIGYVGQN